MVDFMKKIFSLIIAFVLTFTMVGCEPALYYFDKNYYENKIELRYSEVIEMPSDIQIDDENVPHFKMFDTILIETLKDNQKISFIEDFAKIIFHKINECCNQPFGYIVIMYLKNGNFIVISY